jgi:hypothetical protein
VLEALEEGLPVTEVARSRRATPYQWRYVVRRKSLDIEIVIARIILISRYFQCREGEMGLIVQLRNPPGGRDARVMLTAQFLDRTGTGVWAASAVLYLTVEAGFGAGRIGLLLGIGGVAGVFGSPAVRARRHS